MKRFFFVTMLLAASAAHAQTATLSAPKKVAAGSIAVIDMAGSDGDRYDVQVIPAVTPEHLVRDTGGKKLYFATATPGQYAIVLTAHRGDTWALAALIITVGDGVTVDPGEPSDITKSSAANMPEGTTKADRARQRKWFMEAAAKFSADGMKSKKVNAYTAAEARSWSQSWRDHFNATLPAIERANPISPQQWSDVYSDIAKGIPK